MTTGQPGEIKLVVAGSLARRAWIGIAAERIAG
jgi:hypothetical protein